MKEKRTKTLTGEERRRREKRAKRREEKTGIKREREERNKRGRNIWWSLVKVIISIGRKGKLGLEKEE